MTLYFFNKKKKIYINFLIKGSARALHVQPTLVLENSTYAISVPLFLLLALKLCLEWQKEKVREKKWRKGIMFLLLDWLERKKRNKGYEILLAHLFQSTQVWQKWRERGNGEMQPHFWTFYFFQNYYFAFYSLHQLMRVLK